MGSCIFIGDRAQLKTLEREHGPWCRRHKKKSHCQTTQKSLEVSEAKWAIQLEKRMKYSALIG